MDAILTNVTTAATVLGFPVLLVVVLIVLWFGTRIFRDITKIFNEMRYERWKRVNAERDWSNIEASWMLEPYESDDEDSEPVQYFNHDTDVIPHLPVQRHDTQELPQLFNYQEERS